jgi:hypothetical protein
LKRANPLVGLCLKNPAKENNHEENNVACERCNNWRDASSLKEQIRNQGHSIDVAIVTTGQGFAAAHHAPPIEYFLLYHILSY